MIGEWAEYGDKGQLMSHGFGTEIKSYEKKLNGFDLTNCVLSIVIVTNSFGYATLYMDNKKLFGDRGKLMRLAKEIFVDYSEKYKIDGLLIFDNSCHYSVSRNAALSNTYTIDTVKSPGVIEVDIH